MATLNEGTSLQKRSGMARVVEGFHRTKTTDEKTRTQQWTENEFTDNEQSKQFIDTKLR